MYVYAHRAILIVPRHTIINRLIRDQYVYCEAGKKKGLTLKNVDKTKHRDSSSKICNVMTAVRTKEF